MHARAKDTLDLETANNNNLMYGDPVHKNYIYMYTYIFIHSGNVSFMAFFHPINITIYLLFVFRKPLFLLC